MSVIAALARALRDVLQPRVLAVVFLPMLGALALWWVAAWFFWDTWLAALRAFIDSTAAGRWLLAQGAAWALGSASAALVIALLLPAVLITAMIITELVAMPVIVSVVSRTMPGLTRKRGGSIAGSLANASTAIVVFALLWLVTLPLWFPGIGALVLPALNAAYLNRRLFCYDALAEHASGEEFRAIVANTKGRLYGLGLAAALLYYVPLLNLIAPVITGLAFTHFCLAELARLRMREAARPV